MISDELRLKLRQPLPPEAIKQHPSKTYMSSISPAYIVERLNDCFGENGWVARYTIIEAPKDGRMIVVKCDLDVPELSIHRETFGGNDNADRGDAYKGACTDALGKAASQLGIAQDVYKGMHDVEPAEEPAKGKPKQTGPKTEKKSYEVIRGTVTEVHRTSEASLWLQINGIAIRAMDPDTVKRLQNALGKLVELKAYWDFTGKPKRSCLTITHVMGVYEPIPGETQYEPIPPDKITELGITDRDTAQFEAGRLKSPKGVF